MFVILLALFLSLLIIYYQIWRKKRYEEFWKYVLEIPGPKSYPVIGSVYGSCSPVTFFIRERQRAKDFFPIFKIWCANVANVVVMIPEDIELVLNNTKHINKSKVYSLLHAWLGNGLLTSGGAKWQKRRKTLTPAFHFNILQQFIDMLNKETQYLVDNLKKMCNQPYVDVVKPITDYTLYSIGETSFGVKLRDYPNCSQYKQAVHDYGESLIHKVTRVWLWIPPIYRLTSVYRKDTKIVKILHDFSTNLINERIKTFVSASQNDYSKGKKLALLDLMLQAKEDGDNIDYKEIREEVDTFVFEGHDTTSVSLCFTLMVLANEQTIQEKIYKEILTIVGQSGQPTFNDLGELKFMERCVKESLRLYPSVPQIARIAGEDIKTKSGYTIPKGCNIRVNIFELHRSPKIWENPEKFDPDRFLAENITGRHPYAYIPFSAGSRNCIGQKFAMLEIKTALCGILRNFKLEAVDKPEDMIYKADLVLRPAGEIRVKFVPR